jgi:hypothetical protein
MKTIIYGKYIGLGLLIALQQAPMAFAGGTNSGGNTNATPGDNSTSTSTPAEGSGSQRKGTHQPEKIQPPKRPDDLNSNRAGSGTSNNSGNGSSSSDSSSGSGSNRTGDH